MIRKRLFGALVIGALALTGTAASASAIPSAPVASVASVAKPTPPAPGTRMLVKADSGTYNTTVTLGQPCSTVVVNGKTYSVKYAIAPGNPTWACVPTVASPASFRWRALGVEVKNIPGPKGDTGPAGPAGPAGVLGAYSDGPYPGETTVPAGSSSELWVADNKLHRSWVRCDDGKVAVGGGFQGGSDQGFAIQQSVRVTASYPTSIDKSGEWDPSGVIAGDPEQSIKPNAWMVEGFISYAGGDPSDVGPGVKVRPFVVCVNG